MKLETAIKYFLQIAALVGGTQYAELVAKLASVGLNPTVAGVLAAVILLGMAGYSAVGLHWQSSPKDTVILGK